MAHNINFNPYLNRHAFVSVKERPWHGLGTIVENKMTSVECIELAGLNFNVVKVPTYIDLDYDKVLSNEKAAINDIKDSINITGEALKHRLRQSPTSFATIRTDTRQILGSVGSDYTVVNNQEAFEFFDEIVGSKDAIYETAGALGRGETIFITAKIPTQIVLGEDNSDNVDRYIVLSNTHDGSRSLEAFITTIRVVCNNTLAAARNSAQCRFRIRHTKNVKDRVADARQILGLEQKLITAFANNASKFVSIKMSHEDTVGFLADMYLTKDEFADLSRTDKLINVVSTKKYNQMSEIYGHIQIGPGQKLPTAQGTLWGVYNGIASFYQNGKSYNSQTDKMNNLFYGTAYNQITKAYALAEEYAVDMPV